MFSLKKKGREKARYIHSMMGSIFADWHQSINKRLRLDGRIKLVNRYASRHPGKLMATYAIIASIMLSVTIVSNFVRNTHDKKDDPIEIGTIVPLNERLVVMQQLENNREKMNRQYTELNTKGQELYHTLDSLTKIKDKTYSDTIRIMSLYQALNKTFNNKSEHELRKN